MGFLDELKDKAEEFGDKAKEGFASAKDNAEDVIDNVKDRFDDDDTTAEKAGTESIGETAPVGATEPAAVNVEDATTAAQIVTDTKAGSESW